MTNTKYLCLGLLIVGLVGLGAAGILDANMKASAQEMDMSGMAGGENMTGMAGMEEEAQMEGMAGMEEEAEMAHMGGMPTYVVRDNLALNLEGNSLPGGQFIHLYDSTPYMIMNGHVAVNVPCEDNSTASIQVLLGQAPNLTAAELENLPELSTPGELCLYHVDVVPGVSTSEIGHEVITDVAIVNPGEEDIEFPPGSTVVVGVNEIMPGAEEGGHHGAEEGEPAA